MALINSYNGIIAGIGDKAINANIILPEFDAQYRKFVASKNCILDGLTYSASAKQLSAGYCIAEGYVGSIDVPIPNIQSGNFVYGVFTVNHDSEAIDSFEVEVYDSALVSPQRDNILNNAGKYYFQIYPSIDNKHYPKYSQYSDYTNVVRAGGNLQDGVTAVTQALDDNSDKVATNEFVHKQIEKEINADEATLYFAHGGTVYTQYCLAIKFKRKAKFVIGEILGWIEDKGYILIDNKQQFNLPNEFTPSKNTICYLAWISDSPQSPATKYLNAYEYLFSTDGTAKRVRSIFENYAGTSGLPFNGCSFGYETNK